MATPERIIPTYGEVYGQAAQISHLCELVTHATIPHALLFTGKPGGEALPLAMAFARHILCEHPTSEGPCGTCLSCRQMNEGEHPDFSIIYPIAKEGDKETTASDFSDAFAKMMRQHVRFTDQEWKETLNSGNKQLNILVAEADKLSKKSVLKSFQSRHQVVLIWQPETMRTDTANKLLKLFEEPPEEMLFLAVSHRPDLLLPTIVSRFQTVRVPPIPEEELHELLVTKYGVAADESAEIAHLAQGNLHRALQLASGAEDTLLEQALQFLETTLMSDPRKFQSLTEELAKESRPHVIDLVDKVTGLLREANALRLGVTDAVYIPSADLPRLQRIAERLPLSVYPELMDDLGRARSELRQNANTKMVFFDLMVHFARSYTS